MFKRFIPQEFDFFDCFNKAAQEAVVAAKLLLKMTENYGDADPIAREIEAVEHRCDDITHTAMDRLNKVFITPLDREDIHAIIIRLDDVVDLIHASSSRMAFLHIEKPTPHSINMAKQIVRGCDAKRNILVYMTYTDRLIDGSPKNSTSSVPIMPWGAADTAIQKCGDFIQ